MKNVDKKMNTILVDLLYIHKSEEDKPVLITESDLLYHFTFKKVSRGIETTTGCSYDKESIKKMIEQDKNKNVSAKNTTKLLEGEGD
jgi:hypothetical protein